MNTYEQARSEKVAYQCTVVGDQIATIAWNVLGGAGTATPTAQSATTATALVELFEPAKVFVLQGVITLESGQERLFQARIRCAADLAIRVPRSLFGIAPPESGQFIAGDVILNTSPVPGGNLGWVCITAGSPGLWQPYGMIGDQ
ncbi:MAG: hypothetical protein J0H49_10735 [Acidobacteria bacterium]|nr:hypothetical protein [Acidobacteriota bacterium]